MHMPLSPSSKTSLDTRFATCFVINPTVNLAYKVDGNCQSHELMYCGVFSYEWQCDG